MFAINIGSCGAQNKQTSTRKHISDSRANIMCFSAFAASGQLVWFCSFWLLLVSPFLPLSPPPHPPISTWAWLSLKRGGGWRRQMEVKEEALVLLAISLRDSICVYTYCTEYMFRLNMEGDCRWRRRGHVSQSAWAPCSSEHYRKNMHLVFTRTYRSRKLKDFCLPLHCQHHKV